MDQAFPLHFCILQAFKNWIEGLGTRLAEPTTVADSKVWLCCQRLLLPLSTKARNLRLTEKPKYTVSRIHKIHKAMPVVPPVTSIRGLLKKQEVKTKAHSNVQLAVSCLLVSFQSLLPTNERLHAPTLPAVF